jgi:hypothetical protein
MAGLASCLGHSRRGGAACKRLTQLVGPPDENDDGAWMILDVFHPHLWMGKVPPISSPNSVWMQLLQPRRHNLEACHP